MPMVIAATVMVIKSSGISSQPIRPSTTNAANTLGTIAIPANCALRNRTANMSRMAMNTTPIVSIWERNRLCSMLL